MAPPKAISQIDDGDDDDAAPEAVSSSQSRVDIKRRADALQLAELEAKRKRKEKNRLKDENLKKRARETRGAFKEGKRTSDNGKERDVKGKGKERESDGLRELDDGEKASLESRMDRAMGEAQDEGSGSDSAWEESGNKDGDSDEETSEQSDDEEFAEESTDEMEGVEDFDDRGEPRRLKEKAKEVDYLPEHLFNTALSKSHLPVVRTSSTTRHTQRLQSVQNNKKRKIRTSKDLVLGSKTVRIIHPKTTMPAVSAASRTLPPGRVKRFSDSSLGLKLKQSKQNRRSWERKAANIGSLRSSHFPASSFVRNV